MDLDLPRLIVESNRRITVPDLEALARVCDQIEARTILEIGSADGGSSVVLGTKAKERGGHLYCIEPKPTARWRVNIDECNLKETVTLLPGLSPWIHPDYITSPIDLLLIDGNHRTRWALVDYHYWFPQVRIGGMIAFHDYNARKGVGEWVRRAIDIILEDDGDKIKLFGVNKIGHLHCFASKS